MRIVVFSDSHGNAIVLPKIVRSQPKADAFIFLGDGDREFNQLMETHPDKLIRINSCVVFEGTVTGVRGCRLQT